MDGKLLFSYDRFAGMNNVEEAFRIPTAMDNHWHKLYDMDTIENLDIDNSYVLSTRPGCTEKLSGTSVHSLWSDNKTCLFVDSEALYRLTTQYTSVLIATVGRGRMSYAPWNDRIYMTNNTCIGYAKEDAFTVLSDPGITYKQPLPPGKFITYYRGKLYVAKGKVLYISDALCDHYDIRTGFRVFSNDITMLIAVDKGLYISDGVTWFISGIDSDEFKKEKVLDADAIPYTAVVVNGSNLSDGLPENYVLWTSTVGICLGDNDGKIKNLTRSRYAMPELSSGGAVVRNLNETVHYITTLG